MRIVGIDPSFTRTGVCIFEGENYSFFSLSSDKRQNTFARQKRILNDVCIKLKKYDIVTIEEFGVSARFSPSGKFCERIELCGMLKLCIPKITKLPWLSITPSMLKSFATGKSTSHKEDVLEAIERRWNIRPANNDEGDAFVLAQYTRAVIEDEATEKSKIGKFTSFGDNEHKLKQIKFFAFA